MRFLPTSGGPAGSTKVFRSFCMAEGQDSNLHSLSAAVFKTAKRMPGLIGPPRIYQYKSGCAAIKVIEVIVGSCPSPRHPSANLRKGYNLLEEFIDPHLYTRKRVCLKQ